jgi:hypothetical protein
MESQNLLPCEDCLVRPICVLELKSTRGITDGRSQLFRAILRCSILKQYYAERYSDIYPNDVVITKSDREHFLKRLNLIK